MPCHPAIGIFCWTSAAAGDVRAGRGERAKGQDEISRVGKAKKKQQHPGSNQRQILDSRQRAK